MANRNLPETTKLSVETREQSGIGQGHGRGASVQRPYYQQLQRTGAYKQLSLLKHYVTSYYYGRKHHAMFQDVKTYCLFIGHARSSHSIVGALLDAHPHAVVPDEVNVLRFVSAGFSRDQICALLWEVSRNQAQKGRQKRGREGKTYSYLVPGQWQGRFDKLQVIGDTRAGESTRQLAQNPALLQRLQHTLGDVNLKVILVVRNPYDNISTLILRGGRSFENAIDYYFGKCEMITELQNRINGADLHVIRQEEFLERPVTRLSEVCHFLGLEAAPDYLSDCASILYKSPAKSRQKVPWNADLISMVQREIDKFDFLAGYSFES